MNEFDEVFNPKAMDAYKAAEPADYPVQPASKLITTLGEEGKKLRSYLPTYGLSLQGPAVIEPNHFGEMAYKVQFRTIQACPDSKLRSTVFFEVPRFLEPPQLRAAVESQLVDKAMENNSTPPTEDDINEAVASRTQGIEFGKFLAQSLERAIAPLTLRDLMDEGTAKNLVIGAGLRVKERNGTKRNQAQEFLPASTITDTAAETASVSSGDDIPF